MMAPLFEYGLFGHGASLGVALFIGVAFGWTLERAGLGSARKLVGQFYLTDFTVMKVLFTAIVTAMLGAFWLGVLGAIDLARVYVPETYLGPQAAGGLIFGIGFALAGLCPGTSCVSAATGRLDGWAVVAGLFAGVLAAGALVGTYPMFYASGARGAWTIPEMLGAPYGVVVLGIVVLALGSFRAAEWLEARR